MGVGWVGVGVWWFGIVGGGGSKGCRMGGMVVGWFGFGSVVRGGGLAVLLVGN